MSPRDARPYPYTYRIPAWRLAPAYTPTRFVLWMEERCRARGWDLARLAEEITRRSGLPCSYHLTYLWLREQKTPRAGYIAAIAQTFDTTAAEVLDLFARPTPAPRPVTTRMPPVARQRGMAPPRALSDAQQRQVAFNRFVEHTRRLFAAGQFPPELLEPFLAHAEADQAGYPNAPAHRLAQRGVDVRTAAQRVVEADPAEMPNVPAPETERQEELSR